MFIKVNKGDLNRTNLRLKLSFFSNTITTLLSFHNMNVPININTITTLLSFHNMNVPININLYQVEIKIRIRGGEYIHSEVLGQPQSNMNTKKYMLSQTRPSPFMQWHG